MQIKELEEAIGLPLFDRQGRKVALTVVGEYFLVYARRMLATLRDAEVAVDRFKRVEGGTLSIGLVSTAKYFVPQLLARFRGEHPGVELQVKPNREQLVDLLQGGEIELAIMGRPPREIEARAETFAAHPLVFVCAPDHPILKVGHPPVSALAPYGFVVREHGSGTRSAMLRFFQEHGVEPRIAMEIASNETIKQAVIAGMGLSFLSVHTIALELRTGLLRWIEVEGTPVMRSWNVVRMQAKTLSPAAEAFRYYLLEHGERYLAEHDAPLLGHDQFPEVQPERGSA
jgi:LysR family transcriptional regulator, low CO2-responsive transcriptional regulator